MLLFGAGAELDGETRLAELRRHGIDNNAHTDHDLIAFELSCPAGDSAWALDQLRQAIFFGRMDPRQLEKEKRVILEEIMQLRDDPEYLGRMLLMQELFAGHPYGHPAYGDGSTIQKATVEQLQAFYKRFLFPGRCALSVIGDFALTEMEQAVRRNWAILEKGSAPAAVIPFAERLHKNIDREIELDVQESHLFLGWWAPDFNHEHRLPLSLLTHILGRGINPILNGVLRGERRLVEQFDMSYSPLRYGGMVILHMTLKDKNMHSAKSEVNKFLSRISSFNFSKQDYLLQYRMYVPDYLESAKNHMTYDSGNFIESTQNLSIASARFMLLNRNPISGSYIENVEKIKSTDLRRVAGKYLSGKKWVALAIVPLVEKAK
jgi:predicted Zn-dependent peptidase